MYRMPFYKSGTINMSLYVDMNGVWIPPPSAWTIGYSTFEESYAQVIPNGAGSVVIKPGAPSNFELWGGTVVETPMGTFATTSTDLSQYALIIFNNGTRFVLKGLIINGGPASTSQLSNVPLGSLVVGNYVKQYLVTIEAPGNVTNEWINSGSVIMINEPTIINFNNGTRLINPTLNGYSLPTILTIYEPMTLTITYTKQYLVTVSSVFGSSQSWINAGGQITPNATNHIINGVLFTPMGMNVNGQAKPIGSLTINEPLNVAINYEASANVNTVSWGLPALYATATLKCGSAMTTASGSLYQA
jgi:hypothetical protein